MIHLLRHGSIVGCETRRYLGHLDVPLDASGARQARWWRAHFGPGRFASIHASDLSRTMETAAIVAGDQPVIPVPGLRELDIGAWQGLPIEEVRRLHPDAFAARGRDMASYRVPGGETLAEVRDRAWAEFARIAAAPGGDILIVSHSGTIRTIVCTILGLPLDNFLRLHIDYAGLSLISGQDGAFTLRAMNLTPPGPADPAAR